MFNRILVPVDGSDYAHRAVEFAARLSKNGTGAISLIHVVRPTKIPDEILRYIESESIRETPDVVYSKLIAEKILETAVTEAKKEGIEKVEGALLHGDPAQEIISYAKTNHFDVIVLGSRGLGGHKGLTLGSVASKVCQGSNRSCVIVRKGLLDGKRLLIVDDEKDVLDTLEQLLPNCEVETATGSEEARKLLESKRFDMGLFDIMGVDGFGLLKVAREKSLLTVMLTARALSPEFALKAFREGAASYVPKDEMLNIEMYLNDVLEAEEEGQSHWRRWFERLGSYFSKKLVD